MSEKKIESKPLKYCWLIQKKTRREEISNELERERERDFEIEKKIKKGTQNYIYIAHLKCVLVKSYIINIWRDSILFFSFLYSKI